MELAQIHGPDGAGEALVVRLTKLAAHPGSAAESEPDSPSLDSPVGTGPSPDTVLKVLLVEDDPGDAMLLRMALRENGEERFQIATVTTLAAALAHMAREMADVVLLDLTLPDSAGMETVARLQAAVPDVPVVVMTGASDPRLAGQSLTLGAQDYLVKGDASGAMVVRAIRYAIGRMKTQIERQSLIVRLKQEQAAMRRELDAACRMQMDLLPGGRAIDDLLGALDLTVESYFQPSSAIGGDLWGCLEVPGKQVGFFSFDFSGHGVGAALNVFRLHALIREHGALSKDPAAMLASLNQLLTTLLSRGQFATMWLGIIDPGRDELVWSAAGHPPPVLIHPDHSFELLDTRGTPLGASREAKYHNRRVPFPRGSCLFTYSDGLTEAQDATGEMIDEAGLIALLAASRCAAGGVDLPGFLDRFFAAIQPPLMDDLTIVSIKRL